MWVTLFTSLFLVIFICWGMFELSFVFGLLFAPVQIIVDICYDNITGKKYFLVNTTAYT